MYNFLLEQGHLHKESTWAKHLKRTPKNCTKVCTHSYLTQGIFLAGYLKVCYLLECKMLLHCSKGMFVAQLNASSSKVPGNLLNKHFEKRKLVTLHQLPSPCNCIKHNRPTCGLIVNYNLCVRSNSFG